VLEGAVAEREVERALRARPDLTADQRSAAVESEFFGVALWRRRLAWETLVDRRCRTPAVLLSFAAAR